MKKEPKEPAVMFCLECMFKHLRDTEHHLEDAVRVTEGKEREEFETMIDGIRLMRKVVFDKMKTSQNLPSSCPTCGTGSILNPPEFRHDGGEYEQKEEPYEEYEEEEPHEKEHCESETCQTFTEEHGEPTSKNPVPKGCKFTKEVMEDKKHFDKKSFRTLCPECPEARCSQCPPELKCATRVIVGCPKGEYKEGRCQVGLEAQSIHHGD
jgi:hypothetical protein